MATRNEYLELSDYAYDALQTNDQVGDWQILEQHSNLTNGFSATAFRNASTGEVAVAFRGTDDYWVDVKGADLDILLARTNTQTPDALAFYDSIAGTYGPVTVTGHSLGGALAQIVTVERATSLNPPTAAVTFGAPGVVHSLGPSYDPTRTYNVTNYVNFGDLVGMSGDALGRLGSDHVGTTLFTRQPSPWEVLGLSIPALTFVLAGRAHLLNTYSDILAHPDQLISTATNTEIFDRTTQEIPGAILSADGDSRSLRWQTDGIQQMLTIDTAGLLTITSDGLSATVAPGNESNYLSFLDPDGRFLGSIQVGGDASITTQADHQVQVTSVWEGVAQTTTRYPDGMVRTERSDGSDVSFFPGASGSSDTRAIINNGDGTSVVRYWNDTGILLANGTEVGTAAFGADGNQFQWTDGRTRTVYGDGTTVDYDPSTSSTTVRNGEYATTWSDQDGWNGAIQYDFANGDTVVYSRLSCPQGQYSIAA